MTNKVNKVNKSFNTNKQNKVQGAMDIHWTYLDIIYIGHIYVTQWNSAITGKISKIN